MKNSIKLKLFNNPNLRRLTNIFLVFGICFVTNNSFAQDRTPDTGYRTGNSYALSDIETVNTTNGNLMLNMPIASLPAGRGSSPGFTLALQYNSKLWNAVQENRTDGYPDDVGNTNYTREMLQESYEAGWRLATNYTLQVISRNNLEPQVQCTLDDSLQRNAYIWKVQMQFPDGSYHEFKPVGFSEHFEDGYYNISPNGRSGYTSASSVGIGNPSCNYNTQQTTTSGMNYVSVDGSATRLFIEYDSNPMSNGESNRWKLYFPDGKMIENFPETGTALRITDRNGNKTVFKGGTVNGISGTKIEDDAGHFILISHDNDTWSDTVYQPGINGELLATKIEWQSTWVYRKYLATLGNVPSELKRPEILTDLVTVKKITLPVQSGGLTYNFTYNGSPARPDSGEYTTGWGELSSIVLPSEAKAEYGFSLDGQTETNFITNFDVLNNNVVRKDLKYNTEYDGAITPVTETWLYNTSSIGSWITMPDGSGITEKFGSGPSSGFSYRTMKSDGTIVERIRAYNGLYGVYQSSGPGNNAYVKTELTTIPDASGQPSITAIKDYKYDKNGNVLEIKEYDWVPFSSIPRQTSGSDPNIGIVTGLPSNISNYLKRKTVNTYYNQAADAGTSGYDANAYSNPGSAKLKSVIKSTEVQNAVGTPVSRSEFFYDDANNKGNLTESRTWDSAKSGGSQPYSNPLTASNSILTFAEYDAYGNVTKTTDARGVQSTIIYGPIAGPNGTVTGLYSTQTEAASNYASLKRTSIAQYDFYTGLPTSMTDVDNNLTSSTDYDALGRPLKVKAAVGTASEIWSQTEYDDVNRRVINRSDVAVKGDGKKIVVQHFDQLGRVRLSRSVENSAVENPYNEADGIKVQTRYLTGNPNSYQLISNPYRAATSVGATNEPSMGWTRSKSINTGKHLETETFSGAILPAPWSNNSNSTGKVQTDVDADKTSVTEQTGKQRISRTNALGQMTDIWEIKAADADTEAVSFGALSLNGLKTSYSYDIVNNLKTVNQGAQVRTFNYSSLSRLLSAQNPEAGAVAYQYDNNGNVVQKLDARGVTTSYIYDALNRVTNRSYSNESANQPLTPAVTYTYDNILNAKGRLTKVSSSYSTTEYTSFDVMGRILSHQQTTDGQIYTTSNKYALNGTLLEQNYPLGRVVKNTLDAEGDLLQVQSKKNTNAGFHTYAGSLSYTAAGAVSGLRLGNGKWESTVFNSRLQPTQIAVGTIQNATDKLKLNFDYGSTQNNGNVLSQQITVPSVGQNAGFTAVQNYQYDDLNRLKSAVENIGTTETWKQTYKIDRYGNRRFDTLSNNTTSLLANCPTAVCNPEINQQNNRLTGNSFDNAGNTTQDADGNQFIYDGDNKQTVVKNGSGATIGVYYYDGDGKRIKKVSAQETITFVYNSLGQLIAEYANQTPSSPQVSYTTNDHLGSPRIITDENGKVTSRRDFMPYGEEIYTSHRTAVLDYTTADVRKGFSQTEKDNETGLNYFGARYYSANRGRFISADPLLSSGKTTTPQSWNRYAYTNNNPITLVDILGLYTFGEGADQEMQDKFEVWHQGVKDALSKYQKDPKKYSKQISRLQKILDVIGEKGKVGKAGIDVKINFREFTKAEGDPNATAAADANISANGKVAGTNYRIDFNKNNIGNVDASTLAHETQHLVDNANFFDHASFRNGRISAPSEYNLSRGDIEDRGLESGQFVSYANRTNDISHGSSTLYQNAWADADEKTLETNMNDARRQYLWAGYGYINGYGSARETYSQKLNSTKTKK